MYPHSSQQNIQNIAKDCWISFVRLIRWKRMVSLEKEKVELSGGLTVGFCNKNDIPINVYTLWGY